MSHEETEAIASTFSPCIEFDIPPTIEIPEGEPGQLLVGSITRKSWPNHETLHFVGRYLTGSQAERMRRAARKLTTKKSKS
ncbi:MAG: hypothetical protein R3F19_23560 [Verrucomicrobiales bacterium]